MSDLPKHEGHHRRGPVNNGEEFDAFTGWRKLMYWKAGELKQIKQQFNRKKRRQDRQQLRRLNDE